MVAASIGFILPVWEKARLPVIPFVLVVPTALRAFVLLTTVGLGRVTACVQGERARKRGLAAGREEASSFHADCAGMAR